MQASNVDLPGPSLVEIANPIHDYFIDNPRLFAKALYQIKKHNIRSFSQCVTDDGLALLPHSTIITKYSTITTSFRTPAWYTYIKSLTTVAINSFRLKPEYIISAVN